MKNQLGRLCIILIVVTIKGGEPTFRASSFATAGSFSALRPKRPVTAPVMSDNFCLNLTTLPAEEKRKVYVFQGS